MWAALHLIRIHWRTVLSVILLAVLVWACLPAPLKAKLQEGWKKIAHAIGNFNARVLLTVIYSILILPFGLIVRFFADSLHTKKRPVKWLDYPEVASNLEQARHQG